MMNRNDQEQSNFLFHLCYAQISHHQSYPSLNVILTVLQYALLLFKYYDFIDPTFITSLAPPYFTILIILAIMLLAFTFLTIFSYRFSLLNTAWVYLLLFLQSISIFYWEITARCITTDKWCQADIKLQFFTIFTMIGFTILIYVRSHCYYPFYQSSNHLAMNSGKLIIYLYIYAGLLSLTSHGLFVDSISQSKQLAFVFSAGLFALSLNPTTASPLICRIHYVLVVGLLWTTALIWLTPLLANVLANTMYSMQSFWYYWCYSMPIVLGLRTIQSRFFDKGYQWKLLFINQKITNLRDLYLQCHSLIKVISKIKSSQLKTNGQQFKELWRLIADHNDRCTMAQCPLSMISALKIEIADELLEQKRFSKTIQKTLQFGQLQLSNQKDQFPNLIQLNLELTNYQLQVFCARTKGIQLFNRQFYKPDRTKEERWGLFYLKNKIDSFEGSGELRYEGQNNEEISLFKHDIEVSVTMLAQFWFFLSDPKCNLKKLYDLANVLFPLKIGVDKTWKSIHLLQNIESYHLYARYLIKMFNDKEKGLQILEQAKKLQSSNLQKKNMVAAGQVSVNEQHGVIFLQFDGKNSGVMYQVNTACEKIFRYNKGELQGRKVNDIMPRLISSYHDRILENYQQTNKAYLMNKQRPIWGRFKHGYLFPFIICIKPVRNFYSQTSEVYASVKRDLWVRETAFLMTDCEFNVWDVSSSMLGIFPQIHGRVFLKKKMYITEIIPNFEQIKNSLIVQKQIQQMQVNRSFHTGKEQSFTQKIFITLQVQEINIHLSGTIGYMFRFMKGVGQINSDNLPCDDENSLTNIMSRVKQSNIEASNSYWMKRQNGFQFIASVSAVAAQVESSSEKQSSRMAYHGGLIHNQSQTKSLINSRVRSSFQKHLQVRNSQIGYESKIDYGKQIKTKRLQANNIRQIQQLSEQSQSNQGERADQQEQEQFLGGIKPSELNSILQRQIDNKHITFLKILTIIILIISTITSILIYIAAVGHQTNSIGNIDTIISLSSMQSQVMYINMFANKYFLGLMTSQDIATFKQEINQLDSMTSAIPLSVSSPIFYNDGTSQQMLLSFAVNKLIAQGQLLASQSNVSSSSADLYFVMYNSVNGILVGYQNSIKIVQSALAVSTSNILNTYLVYFGISFAAYVLILIIKNIVLRAVLKKKAEILNIFFQIPRISCTSIQKQCQRFIQKLSHDDQDEQIDPEQQQQEQHEPIQKKEGRHKKRTIMGEQQTAYNFVIASLLLLIFLLIYPLVIISVCKNQQPNQDYIMGAVSSIAQVEKQLAKMMSYMQTYLLENSFPLENNFSPKSVINNQQNLILSNLVSIQQKLFHVGEIFDDAYLSQYNSLFFNNLCSNSSSCLDSYGQSNGLNAILYNYYDYIIQRYQKVTNNSSLLLNSTTFALDNSLRILLKTYWRQFQQKIRMETLKYLQRNDTLLFGVLLSICIVNVTVLMWAWLRFYVSLQQKIIATEYILTFIPIDQINKNPKIVKYIKEHVLHIQ